MRSGHRGSLQDLVVTPEGADDLAARSPQVDAGGAVIGETRTRALPGDARDSNQAVPTAFNSSSCQRAIHACWIERCYVSVSVAVASGCDDYDTGVAGASNGTLHGQAEATAEAAPAVIGCHNVEAARLECGHVIHRGRSITEGACRRSIGIVPDELHRDDGDVPVDTSHANAVPSAGANGAGHMGAVVVAASPSSTLRSLLKVPSVNIVHIAISVVVNIWPAQSFSGVGPDVVDQVWVIDLDTAVDHGHIDATAADGSGRPGLVGTRPERVRGRCGVAVHPPKAAINVVGVVDVSAVVT